VHDDGDVARAVRENGERVVLRRARVDDDRLPELARQVDLCLERAPLVVMRRVVAVVVEAGLADRDHLRVRGRLPDRLDLPRLEAGRRVRVTTHDRVDLVVRVGKSERRADAIVIDADRRDAREAVPLHVAFLAHVEVTVGVDHGRPRLTSRIRRTDCSARERCTRPRRMARARRRAAALPAAYDE
jgi:hypothetical protein